MSFQDQMESAIQAAAEVVELFSNQRLCKTAKDYAVVCQILAGEINNETEAFGKTKGDLESVLGKAKMEVAMANKGILIKILALDVLEKDKVDVTLMAADTSYRQQLEEHGWKLQIQRTEGEDVDVVAVSSTRRLRVVAPTINVCVLELYLKLQEEDPIKYNIVVNDYVRKYIKEPTEEKLKILNNYVQRYPTYTVQAFSVRLMSGQVPQFIGVAICKGRVFVGKKMYSKKEAEKYVKAEKVFDYLLSTGLLNEEKIKETTEAQKKRKERRAAGLRGKVEGQIAYGKHFLEEKFDMAFTHLRLRADPRIVGHKDFRTVPVEVWKDYYLADMVVNNCMERVKVLTERVHSHEFEEALKNLTYMNKKIANDFLDEVTNFVKVVEITEIPTGELSRVENEVIDLHEEELDKGRLMRTDRAAEKGSRDAITPFFRPVGFPASALQIGRAHV